MNYKRKTNRNIVVETFKKKNHNYKEFLKLKQFEAKIWNMFNSAGNKRKHKMLKKYSFLYDKKKIEKQLTIKGITFTNDQKKLMIEKYKREHKLGASSTGLLNDNNN